MLRGKVIHAALDCLFSWLSWLGAVVIFSYFFRSSYPELAALTGSPLVIGVLALTSVLFFSVCGVYGSLWRVPGIGTMLRLMLAAALASFAVYAALRLYMGFWSNPGLGVMAFYFLFTLSLIVRTYKSIIQTIKAFLQRKSRGDPPQEPIRTLLVGAGDSANAFLLSGSRQGSRPRKILGIVDSDFHKHGYALHGVRVLGDDTKIPELVDRLNIEEIVIAVPSLVNGNLQRIVKLVPVKKCKVRILPTLASAGDCRGDLRSSLRDIDLADLLGRPENHADSAAAAVWLREKTALITGGGGSIGSELCRQLLRMNVGKIVIYEISENNAFNIKDELAAAFGQKGRYKVSVRIGSVQDTARLDEVFNEVKPHIVFHAAAYKHVPLMEQCPRLAIENNTIGTYKTAAAACRHGVGRFVNISTDKAVNPTSVMGASKRLAEMVVMGLNGTTGTEFVCVRFGNVLESNGSVIPTFKRQIAGGGPVTVTHPEIMRYFMTMPEAARLVIEAGAMAAGGEIFILDMGKPIKIMDLAENLIRMAGFVPNVDIPIEITGLRPGEKLFEELILNEEGLRKTLNDRIFVVKPGPMADFAALVAALESFAEGEDARMLLKRFIPEYVAPQLLITNAN